MGINTRLKIYVSRSSGKFQQSTEKILEYKNFEHYFVTTIRLKKETDGIIGQKFKNTKYMYRTDTKKEISIR